jgi:Domain of unknown function (DUF222)
MAIMQLDPLPVESVLSGVDPGGSGVAGAVASAATCLTRAAEASVEELDDVALGGVIAALAVVESRAVSLRLVLSAEADRRRVAEESADTGTDAWLARLTGGTREQMAGGLRIAGLLQDRYAATREGFAAGVLRVEQVRVIVEAAEQAPAEASRGQVRVAEEWLVGQATGAGTRSGRGLDAKRLRQAARRMFAVVDPDLADRHQAILLGRETRTAQAETFLALHDNGDGSYTGRFRIPELHGHLLTAALDRLTAPRRLSRDRSGRAVVDESALGHNNGASVYETSGAAFCELLEHLPTRGWEGHGGNGTQVLVTLDLDSLLTGLGAARLDTGVAITAGEARRLACGAGLVPAVLDTTSMPLDLGRSRRLHSASQRRALALLHHTCAIAGCHRPFAWCEIHHHRLPWSRGGPTDLDNALPLCGHHHRRTHDTRYDLRQRPDGDWILHRRI